MSGNISDHSSAPPVRGIRGRWGLCVFFVLGVMGGIAGCGGSATDGDRSGPPPGPAPDAALLRTAIDMMQPDRLGINALPRQPAGYLNQWRAIKLKIRDQERFGSPLSDETRTFLKPQYSAETIEGIEDDNFAPQDAEHIRTAFLAKQIARRVTRGVEGQLNQAQVLFDYVNRNVQLVEESEALPLMPYEILTLGEGTAEDRAWVFAELLRQLNLDAVIVKPRATDSTASPETLFVAVVADGELRLFDPLRSTPVPLGSRGDRTDVLPATPADLSDPTVLESLTGDGDDALSPSLFDQLKIELIGTPTLWAPRLAALEKQLVGNDKAVIHQELTGPPNDPSALLNRITGLAGKRWKAEDIRLWSHPQTRIKAHQDSDQLSERWKSFAVPFPIALDPQNQELTVGNPTYEMLLIRTKQLQGEYVEAIKGYLRIQLRQQSLPSQLSASVRSAYADAAEDAFFWSAVCQMEQGTPQPAVDKFSEYIRRTEKFSGSRHAEHARVLMARCLVELGQPDAAIEALEPLKPASAEYEAAEFLKRQLAGTSNSSSPETPPGKSEKPKPTKPQEPEPKEPDSKTWKPAIAEKPVR